MILLLVVIGALFGLAIVYLVFRIVVFRRDRARTRQMQQERLAPLRDKLEKRNQISEAELIRFAENPGTREGLFHLLEQAERPALFPSAFYTLEKSAEANLASWLEYPTELDALPARIEFMQLVSIPEKELYHYYVFRFLTQEPHWAAKHRWMLGVVGPYFSGSKPYERPACTFSRYTKVTEGTAESEARWVHRKICRKR